MVSYLRYFKTDPTFSPVLILVVVGDGLVHNDTKELDYLGDVLILVVVEDGLVHSESKRSTTNKSVLILVVVEDGLVHLDHTLG